MASYSFTETKGEGRFKAPRQESLFRDGVRFTITKAICGTWSNAKGELINKDGSNSIRFITSLSANIEKDALNINTLIGKRYLTYNSAGRALPPLYKAEFHQELSKFLEDNVGRDENDSRFYKSTAKEIGDLLVSKFFAGKTIICKRVEDIYFKIVKDGEEKLEYPYEDIVAFSFE